MLITSITWAVVEVDLIRAQFEEPEPTHIDLKGAWPLVYRDARIDFDDEKSGALHIEPNEGGGCSVYEAKLRYLSPYRIEFTAAWTFVGDGSNVRRCPVSVKARFEDLDRWDINRERLSMQMILDRAKRGPVRPLRDSHSGAITFEVESGSGKLKRKKRG